MLEFTLMELANNILVPYKNTKIKNKNCFKCSKYVQQDK